MPIGFTFHYYGQDLTTINVSTNGFLVTDAEFFLGSPFNSPIPGFFPHAIIAALWQDYDTDPGTGAGSVRYKTLGVAPNRRFVVQWTGLMTQDAPGTSSTFQAVLIESTDAIEFRYGAVDTTSGPTIGVQAGENFGTALDPAAVGAGRRLAHTFDANPCACPADHNGLNGVDLLDIFAYLSDWFAQNPRADFNHMNGVDLLDIFAFLQAWFAGC